MSLGSHVDHGVKEAVPIPCRRPPHSESDLRWSSPVIPVRFTDRLSLPIFLSLPLFLPPLQKREWACSSRPSSPPAKSRVGSGRALPSSLPPCRRGALSSWSTAVVVEQCVTHARCSHMAAERTWGLGDGEGRVCLSPRAHDALHEACAFREASDRLQHRVHAGRRNRTREGGSA